MRIPIMTPRYVDAYASGNPSATKHTNKKTCDFFIRNIAIWINTTSLDVGRLYHRKKRRFRGAVGCH
jgi:hypothetical protein